jgi:hypothetical protein
VRKDNYFISFKPIKYFRVLIVSNDCIYLPEMPYEIQNVKYSKIYCFDFAVSNERQIGIN